MRALSASHCPAGPWAFADPLARSFLYWLIAVAIARDRVQPGFSRIRARARARTLGGNPPLRATSLLVLLLENGASDATRKENHATAIRDRRIGRIGRSGVNPGR